LDIHRLILELDCVVVVDFIINNMLIVRDIKLFALISIM
jgi:hypothetical protein